ncbi:Cysteine protease atg4 [Naganishia albida]|nr:Cysteine protease atg4 [Naganishia albida]
MEDTSFLDIPGPSNRRWRRPPPSHSVSAPPPITQSKGKFRKNPNRLMGTRSSTSSEVLVPGLNRSTASAPDVNADDRSVDSRASSGVVVVDPPQSSSLGTRVSNWWSNLLVPETTTNTRRRSPRSNGEHKQESRSSRASAAGQTLFNAAKQKAVGGVRYLLDGDAVPEGTEDVWVRGVVHRFEGEGETWPHSFLSDFRSTVWCTYRSQYAPIQSLPSIISSAEMYRRSRTSPQTIPEPERVEAKTSPWQWMTNVADRTGLTTDSGWGCMLRTGQCLLANALVHHHLGRDWRLPDKPPDVAQLESAERDEYATYIQILQWFMDDPSPACPFSVHRMALAGNELGKSVGEWFGPSTAAGAVKTLTNGFPPCGLAIVTATDSTIYASEVISASYHEPAGEWADLMDALPVRTQGEKGDEWGGKGVLILAGVRLGMQGVNPLYHESIKALFTFPQSVGIAGGRPSSSYYFIGTQGDNLFYLDPHFTRPAIPLQTAAAAAAESSSDAYSERLLSAYTLEQLKTFHCEKVKKMSISSLDPSMLMGFLVRDREDWEDLRRRLNNLPQRIISIENTVPTWGDDSDEPDIESFTETDVDEESTGLSRQLSASTLALEADTSRDADPQGALVPAAPPSAANIERAGPPLRPTFPGAVGSGIPFPVQEAQAATNVSPEPSDDVDDSFDGVRVPSPASPRHRSRSSGDRTLKGPLQVQEGTS